MKMRLGVEFYIDYAHMLKGHLTCGREHGHTGRVLIEIEGEVRGGATYQENMIMDFADVKRICRGVLDELDHRNLNDLFEVPTAENITKWVFHELSKRVPVCKVTFYEGEGKWCSVEK